MNFGPVLSILGLAQYLQDAETIVTVSRDGYEAIKSAKAMLDSPEGQKFKQSIADAIKAVEQNAEQKVDSTIHPTIQAPAGEYVWDGFEGWVWKAAE